MQFALGHRTRIHILILLNEGVYSKAELAKLIGEPISNVSNHVRELVDAGSIEIAESVPTRNFTIHYYRAAMNAYLTQEMAEEMTPEQVSVMAGLAIQTGSAEVVAALWAGKLGDPRVVLSWDWYNVDTQGREELEAEEKDFLERVREIEVKSTNRRASSGEEAQPMIVTLYGYERARKVRDRRSRQELMEDADRDSHSPNGE